MADISHTYGRIATGAFGTVEHVVMVDGTERAIYHHRTSRTRCWAPIERDDTGAAVCLGEGIGAPNTHREPF